ncbi:MAG TPA: dihydrolipoamide acetyltransferase family protein [Candidatus Dormibacteraeota bacterium]|nr:dihydrolipoamide acetyltransferase family protein [Candidatus Dormibacteraeota bacterium]
MAEFRLPDLGEGVTEGELVEWRVHQGETVERDQILGVIGTDKATVEIPSPFAGVVEAVLVAEGARIRVGDALLRVGDPAGPAAPRTLPEPARGIPRPAPRPAAKPTGAGRVPALPSVRRAARERGVQLDSVVGSGAGGRVRLPDLMGPGRRVPLRGPARAMAERVATGHQHVPQVTVVLEADMSALEARVAAGAALSTLPAPSLLGLICFATLAELAGAPIFNASLDEERLELVYHDHVQLGIAIQTEGGLRVATIRDADLLSPGDFQQELERVVAGGRAGTLTAAELSGSTFTISSGGKQGGLLATPLVNWPNLAILGVHAIQDRAVVRDGQLAVGRRANLSLSFDHRVIDGMTASRLLYQLESRLANWTEE